MSVSLGEVQTNHATGIDQVDCNTALLAAAADKPLTDAGNAEAFVEMYGDLVRYDHARKRWLLWDSHRWRPDDDGTVYRMALASVRGRRRAAADALSLIGDARQEELGESEREAKRKALKLYAFALKQEDRRRLEALLALARTMAPIADNGMGWDEQKSLICVGNGIVDLRTGGLRDGRPEDRITMSTGIDYDPEAKCPRWDRFLDEVVEDDVPGYLKRLFGYSLTAEALIDLLVFLLGVGRNGKSTFMEYTDKAVGDYAQMLSKQTFLDARKAAHSTEKTDLIGSRFAYCEELGEDTLDTGALKMWSGGTGGRARKMRSDTIRFNQTWLLWFTSNHLPKADDNSWGFWSRVRAIDFPNHFTAEDDPSLETTLQSELPGILRWAVEGAGEWYRDGFGELPAAVAEKTAQYREEMDPLAEIFKAGYFEKTATDLWTPTVTLKHAYDEYAASTNWPPEKRWSETYLGSLLGTQHPKKRHQVALSDGTKQQFMGYHGVAPGENSAFYGKASSWAIPL